MKEKYESGTKFYRITSDLEYQKLTLRGFSGNKYNFLDDQANPYRFSKEHVEKFFTLSSRMCLYNLRETLEIKLNNVIKAIHKKDFEFNPEDTSKRDILTKKQRSRFIHKYDKDTGKLIESFISIKEAMESVNAKTHSSIRMCLLEKRGLAYGYMWSYERVSKVRTEKAVPRYKYKAVYRYNKETGLYIDSFKSVGSAAVALGKGKNVGAISRACTGQTESSYGYKWSFEKLRKLTR